MELFYTALVCLGFFLSGYVVGLLQNGIRITHGEDQGFPTEYNQTITDNLDPQTLEYLERTRGNV